MSDNNLVTKSDLGEFYSKILPYLNGMGTPVGTIISVMSNNAPVGFLKCDGSAYSISTYSTLAEHIKTQFGSYSYFGGNGTTTFAVPDLRGEFLRGTGTNSHTNQGSGANVGTHQDATEQLRINANSSSAELYVQNLPGTTDYSAQNTDSAYIVRGSNTGRNYGSTSSWSTSETNVFTSRPANTSVLYCIKY